MRYLITSYLVAMALIAADCQAKCANYPLDSHVEADVKVWACVAVTLRGSSSQFYTMGPMYQTGDTFSGTLLDVWVTRSRVVRNIPNRKWGYDAHRWKVGAGMTLMIAAPVDQVCPASLPSDLTVTYSEQCCDVLPMRGSCLAPGSLYVVEVAKR